LIRAMKANEIEKVASFISDGYYDDVFFHWVVPDSEHRRRVVTDYYKIYLSAEGCVAHVAEDSEGNLIGATVWLPHDVDADIYDLIDKAAGAYAPRFRAVADKSHESEPKGVPFYQLVGVVVDKSVQGTGVGTKLLKFQLDNLDKLGILTYLEASTPYSGGGLYGKFGYEHYGELLVFTDKAVLYPLWRKAVKV